MVGKPLANYSLSVDNESYRGRYVIVYTWSISQPHQLDRMSAVLAAYPQVVLVGVNLDADIAAAKALVTSKMGNATILYDGLDGPLAKSLNVCMLSSIALVGRDGVIIDAHCYRNLEQLLSEKIEGEHE